MKLVGVQEVKRRRIVEQVRFGTEEKENKEDKEQFMVKETVKSGIRKRIHN